VSLKRLECWISGRPGIGCQSLPVSWHCTYIRLWPAIGCYQLLSNILCFLLCYGWTVGFGPSGVFETGVDRLHVAVNVIVNRVDSSVSSCSERTSKRAPSCERHGRVLRSCGTAISIIKQCWGWVLDEDRKMRGAETIEEGRHFEGCVTLCFIWKSSVQSFGPSLWNGYKV
jgi:hypothetical protein